MPFCALVAHVRCAHTNGEQTGATPHPHTKVGRVAAQKQKIRWDGRSVSAASQHPLRTTSHAPCIPRPIRHANTRERALTEGNPATCFRCFGPPIRGRIKKIVCIFVGSMVNDDLGSGAVERARSMWVSRTRRGAMSEASVIIFSGGGPACVTREDKGQSTAGHTVRSRVTPVPSPSRPIAAAEESPPPPTTCLLWRRYQANKKKVSDAK